MAHEAEVIKQPPDKAPHSSLPRYLASAAAVLAVILAMVSMRGKQSGNVTGAPASQPGAQTAAPADPAIPVVAAVVQLGTLTETIRLTGSLKTDENVVLSSKLAGKVILLAAQEGDTVRAGQLVARIDDSEQRAQRDRAVGAVRAAEARLSQASVGGTVKNIGAQMEYVRAQAAVAAARSKLAQEQHSARIQETSAATRVRTAQAGLQSAKERVGMLREGSRRQEVRMAEQSVQRAQIDLADARRKYSRRQQLFNEGAISEQEVEDTQREMELAQVRLSDAQEQRSMTLEGPRSEEVRMAQQQVTQAEQALQDAEANRAQTAISQEQVAAARELLHQAESVARTARAGLVQNRLSQEDVRTAAATVAQLRGDVAYYDELIRQTRMIAPVSGTIMQKLVNLGEFVAAGAKLMTLVSRDSLFLEAVASERQLPSLRPGQVARITVDARPGRVYGGVVREVLPVAEGLSRSSRVRISLRGARDLPIGAFARVILPVTRHAGVIAIPNDAVLSEAGVSYVFAIINNRAKRRNVELGIRESDRVEVTSGLRPGDRIITAGSPAVVDGARVVARH